MRIHIRLELHVGIQWDRRRQQQKMQQLKQSTKYKINRYQMVEKMKLF